MKFVPATHTLVLIFRAKVKSLMKGKVEVRLTSKIPPSVLVDLASPAYVAFFAFNFCLVGGLLFLAMQ